MKQLLIAGYEETTANYRNAFEKLGVCTAVLPAKRLSAEASSQNLPLSRFDGLVLPGGGDISPALFHAENKGSRNIDEELDCTQLELLRAFIKAERPVLGICKGLQLINVCFGGGIIQDLPAASKEIHAYTDRDQIHPSKTAKGTFPALLYGPAPLVNSAHHQGCGSPGEDLLVAQYAPDFVIEAIYHKRLPILAVQWHPERMEGGDRLLSYFKMLL